MEFLTGAMLVSSCIISQHSPSQLKYRLVRNKTSDCDCGHTNAGLKIVGGQIASKHEFPWQVALLRAEYRHLGIMEAFFCAGAIITSKYILTAAHCAADRCVIIDSGSSVRYMYKYKSTTAILGVHNFSHLSETPNKELQVINVAIHHQYDPVTLVNDIALLQLCKRVDFSKWPTIRPACLPPPNLDLEDQNVTVIGWGTTSENGTISPVLQKVTIPVVNDTECIDAYKNNSVNIVETMICAGLEGKDSCQGDSGGPMHLKCAEGHYVVCGIVSFGIGCARAEYPGVYTKVAKYTDWIKKRTGNESCHVTCSTS